MKESQEIIDFFKSQMHFVLKNASIENDVIYAYDQKYYLNRLEGSYDRSIPLLVHHVLYFNKVYDYFLEPNELESILDIIDEPLIYRNEKFEDLLDDLHSIGTEIIQKNHTLE